MSTTEVAYVRIFTDDKRAVAEIAQREGRSAARQAAIIFNLGVKAYREQEARKSHV